MTAQRERLVLDAKALDRALTRITHEILERNRDTSGLVLIGIRTRGVDLASRLAAKISAIEQVEVAIGVIDITLYRDDLSAPAAAPERKGTEILFSLHDKTVILVDDVLFTGRTIRAALDALLEFGRPRSVQLAVLVDRGYRELPIRPDYIGRNLETGREQSVRVRLLERDGEDGVVVLEGPHGRRTREGA